MITTAAEEDCKGKGSPLGIHGVRPFRSLKEKNSTLNVTQKPTGTHQKFLKQAVYVKTTMFQFEDSQLCFGQPESPK